MLVLFVVFFTLSLWTRISGTRTPVCYNYTMRSKWFHLKETAITLRQNGLSMTLIERKLGIPRSTLSGWFKTVELNEKQRLKLTKDGKDGWKRARQKAVEWHRAQKALRLLHAKQEALKTLENIELTDSVLDLAFAMLYFGEGSKSGTTSLASSDPLILKFVLKVLERNYAITPDMVRCELHLRADQDPAKLKQYWSSELGVPLERFRGVYIDKRSVGKPTYQRYKGVCVLYCGPVAIQRKLIYLYNLFCQQVAETARGD